MRPVTALLLLIAPAAAMAAESYDACTGFIDATPTVITTQGTWCLRKDLATALSSGAAITIATNNVTIDCNGFKLGGLGAGQASQAVGVAADNRLNVTVRNCAIRGFRSGVALRGSGGGHLVEDNRLDQSLSIGIEVRGDGNLVQRNRVFDSGTAPGSIPAESVSAYAIVAAADVRDNTVDGVIGNNAYAIWVLGNGTQAHGNRIRNLLGTANNHGVDLAGTVQSAVDNHITNGSELFAGVGIYAAGDDKFCRDNRIANFPTSMYLCQDNGGNVVHGASPL